MVSIEKGKWCRHPIQGVVDPYCIHHNSITLKEYDMQVTLCIPKTIRWRPRAACYISRVETKGYLTNLVVDLVGDLVVYERFM